MFCFILDISILNIFLDPIFIFYFKLGTRGAAMATALSQLISFIILLTMFIKQKSFTPAKIDAIIYMLGLPLLWISLVVTVLNLVKFLFVPSGGLVWLEKFVTLNVVGALLLTLQALLVILIEKKDIRKVAKGVVTYPLFLLSWFGINVSAFFNTKLEWKPIKHIRAVDIKEVQR